jgi:predicted nucleic acid-binding protein
MRFYPATLTYNLLNFIINSPHTRQVSPHYKWNLIAADPDDNKFVDCALNAGADYIVTNDRHFKILNRIKFPPINVIDIDAFNEMVCG